jgi:hypothetical protein
VWDVQFENDDGYWNEINTHTPTKSPGLCQETRKTKPFLRKRPTQIRHELAAAMEKVFHHISPATY